ncbi:MAG: hypothetical protein ABSF71_39840, partial [Terriglobia bacterium]|jgi:hypothetical protein
MVGTKASDLPRGRNSRTKLCKSATEVISRVCIFFEYSREPASDGRPGAVRAGRQAACSAREAGQAERVVSFSNCWRIAAVQ